MLKLPTNPEIESRLQEEAASRGMTPDDYALYLLRDSLQNRPAKVEKSGNGPLRRRNDDDWLCQHRDYQRRLGREWM